MCSDTTMYVTSLCAGLEVQHTILPFLMESQDRVGVKTEQEKLQRQSCHFPKFETLRYVIWLLELASYSQINSTKKCIPENVKLFI